MDGSVVSRTPHFALHRLALQATAAGVEPSAAAAPCPGATDIDVPPVADGHAVPQLFAGTDRSWIGALVPKRWAKRAVTRNTLKRLIYIVSAEHGLPPAAHVVRLRAGFDRREFLSPTSDVLKQAARAELRLLLERAANAPLDASGGGRRPRTPRASAGAAA